MSDSSLTRYLGAVLDNVFTGAPSDAVIAVLLLVVIGMGAVIWFLCRLLYKRETQYQDLLTKKSDSVDHLHEQLQELSERYVGALKELNREYNGSARETARALTDLRVVLAEVKVVVTSNPMQR